MLDFSECVIVIVIVIVIVVFRQTMNTLNTMENHLVSPTTVCAGINDSKKLTVLQK